MPHSSFIRSIDQEFLEGAVSFCKRSLSTQWLFFSLW